MIVSKFTLKRLDDLRDFEYFPRWSSSYKKMIQNLVWATGYNAFAISQAAGVLSGYCVILSPAVGAVLISLSTVIVAVNTRFLKVTK